LTEPQIIVVGIPLRSRETTSTELAGDIAAVGKAAGELADIVVKIDLRSVE
jgi:hypothetical protein